MAFGLADSAVGKKSALVVLAWPNRPLWIDPIVVRCNAARKPSQGVTVEEKDRRSEPYRPPAPRAPFPSRSNITDAANGSHRPCGGATAAVRRRLVVVEGEGREG